MANILPPFPPFSVHEDDASVGPRWKKWLKRFEMYLAAHEVKDLTRKRALLLYSAGEKVADIFETLPDQGKEKEYNKAITALNVNSSARPLAQKFRRLPFHVHEQVEAELKNLEELDIIEQAEGPTPWVSQIVVVPKKTGIRICVDMRAANQAIERERHPVPTVEDLIVDLNGSTVFSKIDLNQGYHQLELEENSRGITTFATHIGLFRYKRLTFGVNSAAEIFQKSIEEVLQGVEGARNISDDIIVFGKNQVDHDEALRAVL